MKDKLLLCLLLLLGINSCFLIQHRFNITNNYIKSNKSFSQGFIFSELIVDSVDISGIPIKYEKIKSVNLKIDNPKGRQTKKIFFYKSNRNYSWHNGQEFNITYLPIIMQKNSWYIIEGLVFFGNPDLSIFIYIDEFGNCTQYSKPVNGNW